MYRKFKAKKTEVDGIIFDSQREARRWRELRGMEQAGEIQDLKRQVEFVLIPEQREPDSVGARGGVVKGKLLERKCSYFADFVYNKDGVQVVEDSKGFRTAEYKIKRKLMLYVHKIRVQEV